LTAGGGNIVTRSPSTGEPDAKVNLWIEILVENIIRAVSGGGTLERRKRKRRGRKGKKYRGPGRPNASLGLSHKDKV